MGEFSPPSFFLGVKMKILEMKSIRKIFGSLTALNDVDFSLEKGEIRGLMGINGAGKSTLMKILSGIYHADSGKVFLEDKEISIRTPEFAETLGIAIVHQEFSLIPHLTVAENLFISRLPIQNQLLKTINREKLYDDAYEVLKTVGINIDPRMNVAELSIGNKQMVEIAKAISLKNPKIIIFDEPTSALSSSEIEKLFAVIHKLKEQQIGIIYITHKLNEFTKICDSITVLRDGNLIGTYRKDEKTLRQLITLMLGQENNETEMKSCFTGNNKIVLKVEKLCGNTFAGPVSFEVKEGEIIGLVGQMGSGRSEVLKTIIGIDEKQSGKILLDEKELTGSVEQRNEKGIGFVAEDRKKEGLLPTRNISENLSISILNQLLKWKLLSKKRETKLYNDISEMTNLSPRDPYLIVTQLSGGNQQKVVIGRWLGLENLKILLLDEPTRGVDVGAKYQIYHVLKELTEKNVSILVASSDLEEILMICDRVVHLEGGETKENVCIDELDLNTLTYLINGKTL